MFTRRHSGVISLPVFQLTDADNELYKDFNIVISERWQQEIADTVFEVVNQETDKAEQKKKAKQKIKFDNEEKGKSIFSNLVRARILDHGLF